MSFALSLVWFFGLLFSFSFSFSFLPLSLCGFGVGEGEAEAGVTSIEADPDDGLIMTDVLELVVSRISLFEEKKMEWIS